MAGFAPKVTVGRFGYEISAEHRAAIEAAIPPGIPVGAEVWMDLEEAFAGFEHFRAFRASYPLTEGKRYERAEKLITELAVELCLFRPVLPHDYSVLTALEVLDNRIKMRRALHATWRAFSGTKDPNHAFLYGNVLRVWTDRLGGKLQTSTSADGPTGPLVRFFTACVLPILGNDTPEASGIRDIVRREKKAREWTMTQICDLTKKRPMGF